MKTTEKIFYFLEFCLLSALAPIIAHAQQAPVIDVAAILDRIINLLATVAVGVIIIVFILAGFKYLFARGDPGKISEANKALIWGLVGTAVIMLAWGAQNFVRFILGI